MKIPVRHYPSHIPEYYPGSKWMECTSSIKRHALLTAKEVSRVVVGLLSIYCIFSIKYCSGGAYSHGNDAVFICEISSDACIADNKRAKCTNSKLCCDYMLHITYMHYIYNMYTIKVIAGWTFWKQKIEKQLSQCAMSSFQLTLSNRWGYQLACDVCNRTKCTWVLFL